MIDRTKGKLAAMCYLSKKDNYRLTHNGFKVELLHYGAYGWCSQGSYMDWESVAEHYFNNNLTAGYVSDVKARLRRLDED